MLDKQSHIEGADGWLRSLNLLCVLVCEPVIAVIEFEPAALTTPTVINDDSTDQPAGQ